MARPRIRAWMSWVPGGGDNRYHTGSTGGQVEAAFLNSKSYETVQFKLTYFVWPHIVCGTSQLETVYPYSCSPSYVLTASRFMTWRMMWYSSAIPFPPNMSLACRAMSRALPQLFLFSMDIISGAALLKKTRTYLFCSRASYAHCQPLSSRLKHWKSLKTDKIIVYPGLS